MLGTVFHYSVTPPEDDHARCFEHRNRIIAMHESMGYRAGGAYNGHFCHHGEWWLSYTGPNAATGNTWANLNLHAWCYLATVGTPVTPAAQQAAYELTLFEPTGRDQIYPHSAFFATSCCGDPLRDWIAAGALPPDILSTTGGNSVYHMLTEGPAGPGNDRCFKVDGLQIISELDYGAPRGAFGIHQEALDAQAKYGIPIVDGRKTPPFAEKPLQDLVVAFTKGKWKDSGAGGSGLSEDAVRAIVADVIDGTTLKV